MADPVQVTLRYHGGEADDGTMRVSDVISALQGFGGAYSKVASAQNPDLQHLLRVSALKTESFELIVLAWVALGQEPTAIQTLELLTGAVRAVIGTIVSLVTAKKHTQGKTPRVEINGDNNNVVLVNGDNARFEMSPEDYKIYQSGAADSDLEKIVRPLEGGRVERAELTAGSDVTEMTVTVSSKETPYFHVEKRSETVSRETSVDGLFVSLNKENNRGLFKLGDGTGVHYEYKGSDPIGFHAEFGQHGTVRVNGQVTFDQNLKAINISVDSVMRIQGTLAWPNGSGKNDH